LDTASPVPAQVVGVKVGRKSRFPGSPWEVLTVSEPAAFQHELSSMLEERMLFQGAPRDQASLEWFLAQRLAAGRILIYGAGSRSAALQRELAKRADVHVVGFVDKWAGRMKNKSAERMVLPCEVPDMIASGEVDQVLLFSPLWEMQMLSSLIECGVARERVQAIYADPRYAEYAWERAEQRLALLPERARRVVVDFARQGQTIIADQDLGSILGKHQAVRLYSERFEGLGGNQDLESFGFANSLRLLGAMLERLRPELVYLRSFVEDNFLSYFIKQVVPSAKLVHEAYDFSLSIPEAFLRGAYGHNERSIQMAYSGEAHSFRCADFVVGKRGGPLWDRVLQGQRAPYGAYFAQLCASSEIADSSISAPRPGEPMKVIYAGNLPSEEVLEQEMACRLLPLFRELSEQGILKLAVYNGAHRCAAEDEQFAYISDLTGPLVSYSPGVPYAEILERMSENHYGWLYVPREQIEFDDEEVLISNRFTGYVAAGLPVVIDDGWTYMADLVHRFDAGIVVPMEHPELLGQALASADYSKQRRGVAALRSFMIDSNELILQELRDLVGP